MLRAGIPQQVAEYLSRLIDDELDELIPLLPAIVLEGPKGVGKTETARRRARTIYQLDETVQRAIADAEPELLLSAEKSILLDEWPRSPPVWDAVRRAVDREGAAGQFLLTGSASPAARPTHSGAGRIVSLRMRPLSLAERGIGKTSVTLSALLTTGPRAYRRKDGIAVIPAALLAA